MGGDAEFGLHVMHVDEISICTIQFIELHFRHIRRIAKSDPKFCDVSLSVCPPVRMEQLCSHCMDFHEINI